MRKLICRTLVPMLFLGILAGCGDEANKGINKGKDKPATEKNEKKAEKS